MEVFSGEEFVTLWLHDRFWVRLYVGAKRWCFVSKKSDVGRSVDQSSGI